jgi:cysteine synthase A
MLNCRIAQDLLATVGHTPLVRLGRLATGLPGHVVAKLEMRNPCGSVKDRLGVALIDDAERRGALHPGMTIIEATGGNTGIGLAFAAALRGYPLILTMPETMSMERVALLEHLGARVLLTPQHSHGRCSRTSPYASYGDCRFDHARPVPESGEPGNAPADYGGGGLGRYRRCRGCLVSAVGTSGTTTGVGEFLKERKKGARVVAVEPAGAPYFRASLQGITFFQASVWGLSPKY